MTSVAQIIDMTLDGDGKYVRGLQAGGNIPPTADPIVVRDPSFTGTLTGPTSVVPGADASVEAFAEFLQQSQGGGLSFADQLSLELQVQGLRNQGQLAVTGLSGQIQRMIAELQEAGETGRTRFTTEAQARTAAQQFANLITTGLGETLEAQGFVSPALAALGGRPSLARAALIEALREGTIFPTLGRQQLLAQAAAEPSDIVRLLALSAGREPLAGAEQELQETLAFNQPKLVEEGRSAQLRLAEQLEGLPDITFQEILDRLLPLVEEPEPTLSATDIAGLIAGAGGGGIGGVGGGPGGVGGGRAFTGDVTRQATQAERDLLRGREIPARGTTATPAKPGKLTPEAAAQRRVFETNVAFERAHALAVNGRGQEAVQLFTPVVQGLNLKEALALQQRMRTIISEGNPRLRLFTAQLVKIVATRVELLQGIGRGRLAKGGHIFDPGFFIVGEGGDGMKRGSAEFAFLAEGSVVAPMKKGEKPTMKNARRAVAEMILHGRRGKDGEPIKKLAHGGVTVVSGDNLWTIIQRLGGDPTRWPEVAKAIGLSDPRRLQIGTLIPFEVLQRVGARVPAPPAPAPAPAPTQAPAPTRTPTPAAAPGRSPEEEQLQQTISGIETLLGPGGTVAGALRSGRSIAEILAGFTLSPSREEFQGLDIDPELQRRFFGPATQFPFQEFQRLPTSTQSAISSLLGTVSGDKNLVGAITGLQQSLRNRAFSGNQQLALTR